MDKKLVIRGINNRTEAGACYRCLIDFAYNLKTNVGRNSGVVYSLNDRLGCRYDLKIYCYETKTQYVAYIDDRQKVDD